jgi:hypothetical protein
MVQIFFDCRRVDGANDGTVAGFRMELGIYCGVECAEYGAGAVSARCACFFRGVCGWMEIAMELPLLLFLRGSGIFFGSPAEEDEISTAALTARCWFFWVFAGWIGKMMELPLWLFLHGTGFYIGFPVEDDEIAATAVSAWCWVFLDAADDGSAGTVPSSAASGKTRCHCADVAGADSVGCTAV